MRITLLESDRRFLQTAECALLSIAAHSAIVWGAFVFTQGGRLLPANEREARVFFLLPPDRVQVPSRQIDDIQWGKLGTDLENGRHSTIPSPGIAISQAAAGRRGASETAGARGQVPVGADISPPDTVFSILEVDSTVERFDGSVAPAYPPELLARGREGTVYVQFVVDTSGRVDTTTIRVLSSPDPQFEASVRAALAYMLFHPAKRAGRAVRQLVEQHFRFTITAPPQIAERRRVS